jgi:hypothetical protein
MLFQVRPDGFFIDASEGGEFFDGDELSFFLFVFFSDEGKELPGGTLLTAGDVHDVFGINDAAHWYLFLHIPAPTARDFFSVVVSFYSCGDKRTLAL